VSAVFLHLLPRASLPSHAFCFVVFRYSVFTVMSIDVPAKIVGDNPVVIHIQAAIDNANEDDDLPLAPWH
jgi:hypothetical protein